MSKFFREVVNMSNQLELERKNIFDVKVNKYLSTIEATIRQKIIKNIQYRKIVVKEPWNPAKFEAINRVCNKLREEGFSVIEYARPSGNVIIISW